MTDYAFDLGYLPSFITAPDSQALCAEIGGDAWFPEVGGPIRAVKAICNRCELIEPCRAWGLANAEPAGIWGGLTEFERRTIRVGAAIPRRPPGTWTTPETRAQVIDLFRHGWRAEEIAREIGISVRTVHRIRARHEVENAA